MPAPQRPRRAARAIAALGLLLAGGLAVAALAGSPATPEPAAPTSARAAAAAATGCGYRPRTASVRRGSARGRRVALTFDDGPSRYTARILDVLEAERVPATFFVVGANIAGREALLRRMLDDGDAIGNHSFDHVDLARANAAALGQIDATQTAIRAATGFTPCLLRPPYGSTSRRLLGALDRRQLTSTLWSVNPQDFRRPGSATIRRRVLAGVRPGAIVLQHDGGGNRGQTVAVLGSIIRTLKARGYRFVTVTELLALRATR